MKLQQKQRISYPISKGRLISQLTLILENGLYEEFMHAGYKTMTWFLKSKGFTKKDWENNDGKEN